MNFLNGLTFQTQQSVSPYASPARQVRRLLWAWLHKVIGWDDNDKSGTKWDDPPLTGTDGATDASNAWKFTSATGGFTAAMVGGFLVVHPTDAVAGTSGGFTDPDRNGFYRIKSVPNGNTLYVAKTQGVDLDGFPLSESGLAFSIYHFYDNADLPSDNDFFVLEGDISGGSDKFHFRSRERYDANYGRHYVQISPYADWDNVAHDWDVNNRVSAEISNLFDPANSGDNEVHLFGGGNKNYFWAFWEVGRESTGAFVDAQFLFCGEFLKFHAADQRPVSLIAYVNPGELDPESGIYSGVGTNADGSSPVTLTNRFMCANKDSDTGILEVPAASISRYSGRRIHTPFIVSVEDVGYEAIRGQYPFKRGHSVDYVGYQPQTLGNTQQFLRLHNLIFPWNGSDVRQSFF